MKRRSAKSHRHSSSSKGKMSLKKIVIIAVVVVLALIALDKMSAPKTYTQDLGKNLDDVNVESSLELEGIGK